MFKPRNKTVDLLLSITKNRESLIDQTYKTAVEKREFTLSKWKESFSFDSPSETEKSWMIALINLKVYNSIFI